MAGWTTLVPCETLAGVLAAPGLRILDCRSSLLDKAQGERDYAQAHLPGAVYAHLERDLSNMHRQDAGRHPWPDAAAFTATLGRWGIAPDTQVVAYDDADGAYAARAWCLLRLLGHARVAVLDGGWQRWNALRLPVTADVPDVAPAAYSGDFDHARLLDAAAVASHVQAGGLLVDARAAARFRGDEEPIDAVAGHVPGAVNRPYARNLADGRFKAPDVLAEEFDALFAGRPADDVAVMCGSGVTACHHLLAMAHAGLAGAKLFTGSWSGWIADPSRPIATGEAG
jgi:thiosulfate/3-mercaptopyruvate sulfurtransferase